MSDWRTNGEHRSVLLANVPDRESGGPEAIGVKGAADPFDGGVGIVSREAGAHHPPLRICDVDLASGVIQAERGWDPAEGAIELKTNAGRRRVPIAGPLRDLLTDQRMGSERVEADLIFGRTAENPFRPSTLQSRADEAWKEARLERITFHECRHTFASLMIAAGVNAKALSTYMGHANISITLDRYGHLMPGSEEEAARLLETYLTAESQRADDAARAAAPQLRPSEPQSQPDTTGSNRA